MSENLNEGSVSEAVESEVSEVSEVNEESSEEISSEIPNEEAPKEAPQPKKYKTIIDGQEYEVTEEELIKGYQRSAASLRRFQEAAKKEQELEAKRARLKEDPVGLLKEEGFSDEQIRDYIYGTAKRFLDEEQEIEQNPHEVELRKLKEENEKLRKVREEEIKQKEQEAYQIEMQRQAEKYNNDFQKVLASSGLTPTPMAVAEISKIMLTALKNNYDMSVEEAVDYYKEERNNVIMSNLRGLSADQLIELLGKDAADKIRKYDLAKIKNPVPQKKEDHTTPKPRQQKRSFEEFLDSLK